MKAAMFLPLLVFFLAARSDADPGIWVDKVVFTRGVDKKSKQFTDTLARSSAIGAGPLYLWTLVKGGRDALEKLRIEKKLPLRHRWAYIAVDRYHLEQAEESGDEWSAVPQEVANQQIEGSELLRAGTVKSVADLESEIEKTPDGAFDWRSWSGKKRLRSGWYRVDVVTNDGEVVLFAGKPCTLWVRIL